MTEKGSSQPAPLVDYLSLQGPLDAGPDLPRPALLLAVFGSATPRMPADSRALRVRVPLEPLAGEGLAEVWFARGVVNGGEAGPIRFSSDDHLLAGVIEVSEREHGGILGATTFAYRTMARFLAQSRFPHLLRTWNHLDAITEGLGDTERYREFCTGRVAGLGGGSQTSHPAATVIGTRDGNRVLQVFWLAGRTAGRALENPRQVPAFRYPRAYGETAPTFSRAMLMNDDTLLISGTASIVGHESRHRGSVGAQLREILVNLDSLLARAKALAPALPSVFDGRSRLKVYLRHREHLPEVLELLRCRLPSAAPLLILQGDVCRSDLLVELEGAHFVAS